MNDGWHPRDTFTWVLHKRAAKVSSADSEYVANEVDELLLQMKRIDSELI